MCYPNVLGHFLPIFVYSKSSDVLKISGDDVLNSRKLLKKINELLLNNEENALLMELFELIFVQLLNRVCDLTHFEAQFRFRHVLPVTETVIVTVEMFQATLEHIEEKISNSCSIISFCASSHPEKLEKILFEVTSNIFLQQSLESKLLSLHRYSILIDIISSKIPANHELTAFLARSTTTNLMNIIKLSQNTHIKLSIAACRYFKKFAEISLINSPKIFDQFLILIVSTLTPIAKLESALSTECLDLLKFLIIENSSKIYGSIGALDPFPKDQKFSEIFDVYEKIKYGNECFSLEKEIRCFLNVGNNLGMFCDRTDGLKHLKNQLSGKKDQLRDLYAKLNDLRGFCQHSDESVLHQLICMLVELTTSPITQVKLEAARCLGELGPSDLTTLVLKPEKIIDHHELTPLELITNHIIIHLTKLIVSPEISKSKNARTALYSILSTKEGANLTKKDADYGCGFLEKNYILPFVQKKRTLSTNLKIIEQNFQSINNSDLWCPLNQRSHRDWIILLVSELLQIFPLNTFLRDLIPVCNVEVEFAELLLPLIIFFILTLKKSVYTKVLSKHLMKFFEEHWLETRKRGAQSPSSSQDSGNGGSFVVMNRRSVQCMLNTVHFVRLQQNMYPLSDQLHLNYLHVAQAAQHNSAYFTSILYSELWCYDQLTSHVSNEARSILETVNQSQDLESIWNFENLLREAYKKIGDLDAVHGCGTSYILNTKSRIDYYKNIEKWDKVVLYHNSSHLSCESSGLISALKQTGLHQLALNIPQENANKYECAWRLNNWTFSQKTDNYCYENFEMCHFSALKALNDQDYGCMDDYVKKAKMCVIWNISHSSLECSKSLYVSLTQLKMLQDLEDFLKEDFRFLDSDTFNQNGFEYLEPIRAQRICLTMMDQDKKRKYLVEMYLNLAEEARKVGVYHVSQQSLDCVSGSKDLDPLLRGRMLFEQAQLSWLDDKTSGRYLLKYILDNNEDLIPLELYGKALTLYGNWMVETRSENPATIIENYFEKSLGVFEEVGDAGINLESKCDALNSLARFADVQYQQVTTYIASSSFESKLDIIKKSRDMAIKIKHDKNTSDERRAIALYEKQSKIDETEVSNAYQEKDMYLILAVKNYLRILELSDIFNLKIFRILSLSLDNKQNQDLLNILETVLPTIATYKFIPLLPQLVPHIGQTDFEQIIMNLLERCAHDHPHHTLPIILAVSDSYKDRNYDRNVNVDTTEPRVQIAKQLIQKLKKKKSLSRIIINMEQVSTGLISLAYVDASKCAKRGNNGCVIPRNEGIKSIRDFGDVVVPTLNLEIRKHRNYTNIVGISEFSSTFSMVGGVNAPKKITCTGSDGIQYTQLVKGKDDLRQDAVMQQVFSIMNEILAKNKQTSKLLIRTYKVVPLSQRSGILEWCLNTEPLGTYLNDAHRRYHPVDWSPADCRTHLRAVHLKDPITKHRKYLEICANFRPVMHMFFIDSYPQPTVWYERRRAYIHSVATSSMVGYILGLGDRHVHNILLDTGTAEVVHIDFGIAFEQGKCLPTPETVPFRLSRDIEAGMGVCGIEGVFRKSCEKTMQVLRQHCETVLTILQVLLYDPLYVWTITPAEAYSRQKDDDERSIDFSDDSDSNVNITAERALLRLKEKLQGMENGAICSVEGQVELLLQQARDPVNLSRLFNGWQPYL